jgi:small subunit ribosomal protein S5
LRFLRLFAAILEEFVMARDREPRQDGLEERVVKIRRCAAVVKGGRRFSFNALVVVGDRHGRVSWGYGKANEVPPAVEKAVKDAQETMKRQKKIPLRGETIPHRVIGQFGGSRVILVPAGPGTGVKAGPGVRDVLEACGIHNILTKTHGSTNPINLVKATIQGLLLLRTREDVARLRGVTL